MDVEYLQSLMGGTLEESPAAAYRNIWVLAETRGPALARVTLELIGRARTLADALGVRVVTVIAGDKTANLAAAAIAAGSDIVYTADSPLLASYRTETSIKLLAPFLEQKKPEIVLLPATVCGQDLAPRLAALLNTGVISDCVAIDIDESERLLLGTRETYGGRMLATVDRPRGRPQIATVRPGAVRPLPADPTRQGTVERIDAILSEQDATTLVETSSPVVHHLPLHEATAVVAGGRGMGGKAGFQQLQALADVLGAVVGASRSAVELGWALRESMIDIAGQSIQPDLYVAVGISGASGHRIATRGARCLVAINSDSQAPILRRADYSIVGDWQTVLPELIAACKEAKER